MLHEDILKSRSKLKSVKISYYTYINYFLDGSFNISLYDHTILSLSKKVLSIGNKRWYMNYNRPLTIKRINEYLPENFKVKKVKSKLILTTPFGLVKFDQYIEIDLKKGIVKFKD